MVESLSDNIETSIFKALLTYHFLIHVICPKILALKPKVCSILVSMQFRLG